MIKTHTLGFPRMGKERELKWAVEAHWKKELNEAALLREAANLRAAHWDIQKNAGMELVAVGDFALYDHMLDMICMLGATPERFGHQGGPVGTDLSFRMARGDAVNNVAAMEMTKWFDTNYHYIVPEFTARTTFTPHPGALLEQIDEAVANGHAAKAVLPGPFTFLQLGKFQAASADAKHDKWPLLDALLSAYESIVRAVAPRCAMIQFDEPILATDLDQSVLDQLAPAYVRLAKAAGATRTMLATYFGPVDHHAAAIAGLPVDVLHLDMVRGPKQLDAFLEILTERQSLSLGVVDGRNIWRTEFDPALQLIAKAVEKLGTERVLLAPSCSLLHAPMNLSSETDLNPSVRQWMAFAVQKCTELNTLARAVQAPSEPDVAAALEDNRRAWAARRASPLVRNQTVRERIGALTPQMFHRPSPFAERNRVQAERLRLPPLPTTTIGSFPQTPDIRKTRRDFKRGELGREEYVLRMQSFIADCVQRQTEAGLDVLVHGEPERNDMVEYFGELLDGFCFTANGWVQSYGSRCVKPPIIFGDVSRPAPMTVEWSSYAASLTDKPMKGMLTGPVTILSWSFVRDDQPRNQTCEQIALAIRDEVAGLENAGLGIIQIDEPGLREGLPLRHQDWDAYIGWAVACFRLATSSVNDATQIHTHMCYAEVNDIIEAIAALDADVISIEASRSAMELLDVFARFDYPNEIGPGVWDIHSPRVPSIEEITELLERAARAVPPAQLWVNPDCGLKTRAWPETEATMKNMVQAAQALRKQLPLS